MQGDSEFVNIRVVSDHRVILYVAVLSDSVVAARISAVAARQVLSDR